MRVFGAIYSNDLENETGDVVLTVRYYLNQTTVIDFGGVMLRDIPLKDRRLLNDKDAVAADCTVGPSVPILLMGSARVMFDCTVVR